VYPVFIFNENKIFKTSDSLLSFRLFLNRLKIPGVFYLNAWGIIPGPDKKVNVVVGKPLRLPLVPAPTQQDVDYYHAQYV
jgi:hypothetical protein